MITLTLPMPRLGETMDCGTIASWTVAQGENFARGDTLLELETDKTLVEYPALGPGRLVETLVAEGDVVDVGDPIAIIETDKAWPIVSDQDADASTSSTTAPPSHIRSSPPRRPSSTTFNWPPTRTSWARFTPPTSMLRWSYSSGARGAGAAITR